MGAFVFICVVLVVAFAINPIVGLIALGPLILLGVYGEVSK
jgi:hypothetical protein